MYSDHMPETAPGQLNLLANDSIVPRTRPGEPPGLMFLLDSIDATELAWQQLPQPTPLFVEELRLALMDELGLPIVEVHHG